MQKMAEIVEYHYHCSDFQKRYVLNTDQAIPIFITRGVAVGRKCKNLDLSFPDTGIIQHVAFINRFNLPKLIFYIHIDIIFKRQ